MSLLYKDNRNTHLKSAPAHAHHLPTQKQLIRKRKKLQNRVDAVEKEIENVNHLEEQGDMQYFELTNRKIKSEKTLERVQGKLNKLHQEIDYTDQVSRPGSRFWSGNKGMQKSKDIDFRIRVHGY